MGKAGNRRPRPALEAARKRICLTQEQAADAVGIALSTWVRWVNGSAEPSTANRAKLIEVFGVTPAELDQWLNGQAIEPIPWLSDRIEHRPVAATVEAASELWRWDMGIDPSRRQILASLPFVPAVLGDWLLAWAYGPPITDRARTGGPRVGIADIHRVNEARQAFSQMDHQHGGGLVRPAVIDYLNTQVAPMLTGTYTDEVGAQLMTAAAAMTRLAGWEAYDLGRHGLAQAHFGQALPLAKAADDPLTAAWVLAALAQQACDLRHPDAAGQLSRAASHAGALAHACPRVRALLLVREARATALGVAMADTFDQHAATRARTLIRQAEHTYAAVNPDHDSEPTWVLSMGPAELAAEIGCCWRLLGEHQRARECAERALRGLGPRFPRSMQLNTVHLAQAFTGEGQLEAALTHARAAIPMAQTLTSHRAVSLLRDFDRGLDDWSTEPSVREWREYLHHELPAA